MRHPSRCERTPSGRDRGSVLFAGVLFGLLGFAMAALPEGFARAVRVIRISSPAPDSAGRVRAVTRRTGYAPVSISLVAFTVVRFV